MDGLCHVRAYQQPGRRPVVIVGELGDNPGTFVPNAIEVIAAAIQRKLYPNGREFQLIQSRPADEFLAVEFLHRPSHEHPADTSHSTSVTIITGPQATQRTVRGPVKDGDFRDPRWSPIDATETVIGCVVERWQPDEYTASSIAGAAGQRLHDELMANARDGGNAIAEELR